MLQKMKGGGEKTSQGQQKKGEMLPGDPQEPMNDQTETEPALHSPEKPSPTVSAWSRNP